MYLILLFAYISGMEALETSINYWEDALAAFSLGARGGVSGTLALTSPEEAEFCREIQDLLQDAYLLQVQTVETVIFHELLQKYMNIFYYASM